MFFLALVTASASENLNFSSAVLSIRGKSEGSRSSSFSRHCVMNSVLITTGAYASALTNLGVRKTDGAAK